MWPFGPLVNKSIECVKLHMASAAFENRSHKYILNFQLFLYTYTYDPVLVPISLVFENAELYFSIA